MYDVALNQLFSNTLFQNKSAFWRKLICDNDRLESYGLQRSRTGLYRIDHRGHNDLWGRPGMLRRRYGDESRMIFRDDTNKG